MSNELVVGIDLGTTNSEIAVYHNGKIVVIDWEGEQIMPSVVGLSPDGNLMVGTSAKNQALVYPERTVISVKRRMGTDDAISLGEKTVKPQEISAMILRELKRRAEAYLGHQIQKAVITVPAFFSDSQRKATQNAGEIAGFQVMRILNEPTAASLAYESDPTKTRMVLVYDLGGGTFDVSIVEAHGEVTEVLASHGDTKLGGDDFDRLLMNDVVETMISNGLPDPRENRMAMSRLSQAVVKAKHELSSAPFTRIREENLLEKNGVPIHLDQEITLHRYEDLVRPLVEKTFESVSKALQDAGKKASDLDAVLLVGGMTRTPLVERRLTEVLGKQPRRDVHPDLAVAMGAGVMASRLGGHDDGRVLVDITPYSFGPEVAQGGMWGIPVADIFHPLIKKGSPLPSKASEEFYTMVDNQEAWDVKIFQGENPVASKNIKIGDFVAKGFANAPQGNPILCTLALDIDGILQVTVTEKITGLTKQVRIENALGAMAKDEVKKARENLDKFFGDIPPLPLYKGDSGPGEDDFDDDEDEDDDGIEDVEALPEGVTEEMALAAKAFTIVERAKTLLSKFSENDRKEANALLIHIEACLAKKQFKDLPETLAELDDLLYFAEECSEAE